MFVRLKNNENMDDLEFDTIYPKQIQKKAALHFTPIHIARLAATLLDCTFDSTVLDIGAGVGKFCTINSIFTRSQFVGVEKNPEFINIANNIIKKYRIQNVTMIHADILNVSFSEFNSFYFFNSFADLLSNRKDPKHERNKKLFLKYSDFVKESLDKMPPKTRLVTYFSNHSEIPESYSLKKSLPDYKLKLWQRM